MTATKKSLSELLDIAIAESRRGRGSGRCKYGRLLDSLTQEDQDKIATLIENNISRTIIYDVLADAGHDMPARSGMHQHYGGTCGCAK